MSELIVIGYESSEQAENARSDLLGMAKEYYVDVADAVVAHVDEKGDVKLNQIMNLWSIGAMSGSVWGLLIGLIFLHPLFGLLAGAAAGAVGGALADHGISDKFMKEVASILQPGNAALFILARRVQSDRVIQHLAGHGGQVLRTNLDLDDEQKLRDAFNTAQTAAHSE